MLSVPVTSCVRLLGMSRLGRMMEIRLIELSLLSYHHHHIVPPDVILIHKSITSSDAVTSEEIRAYDPRILPRPPTHSHDRISHAILMWLWCKSIGEQFYLCLSRRAFTLGFYHDVAFSSEYDRRLYAYGGAPLCIFRLPVLIGA